MRSLLLLALAASATLSAQPTGSGPVRPDWDVVPYPAEPIEAGRPVADRLSVVGAVAVPFGSAGALLGYTDGLQNQLRWCIEGARYSDPECLAINEALHTTAAGGRALVVVALASAATVAADLTPLQAGLVTLSASAVAGMAFNLGHNAAEDQPYYYYGEVAATDQLARRLGPRAVFWGSAAATAAVLVVTVVAL